MQMNKYEQRQLIELDMGEYKSGYMDRRTPKYRLNKYVECFGGDNWINSEIHKYNEIKKEREKK